MRHDEPTRPIHVTRLRSVQHEVESTLPADEELARRAALAVDRETEPLPKIDPAD
jgi:hypothetical protein